MFSLERSFEYCSSLKGEGEALAQWYLGSNECLKVVEILEGYFNDGPKDKFVEIRNGLVGRVTEDLALIIAGSKIRSSQPLILNSENLVNVVAKISGRKIISHRGGLQTTIMGVTLSDIAVLDEGRRSWQITKIVECKLKPNLFDRRLRRQLSGYRSHGYLERDFYLQEQSDQNKFGKLLSDIFKVDPKPVKLHPKLKVVLAGPKGSLGDWGGQKIEIPLTRDQLVDMADNILSDAVCSATNVTNFRT